MSRSALSSQICPCNRQALHSITITGSTLGEKPRRRSRAVTVYVCKVCERNPTRATRRHLLEALLTAALDVK
jgi:hypothetical protein